MENNSSVSDINYKNFSTPYLGKMYDVIEIQPDGTSLLASSNMCSRYWTGHLSVYNTPEDLGDNSKCKSYMEFDGGIPCAKFISDSKVLVGLDTGCMSLIDVNAGSETGSPVVLTSVTEHDHVVTSLSLSSDKTRAISGSMDKSLKVWNTDYLVSSHTFRPAHADIILDIAYHPENNDIFASCSLDGQVTLWDLRQTKPALALPKHFASRPSCLSFRRRGQCNLLVGTISGHILEVDVSSVPSKYLPMLELGVHDGALHKISVAPHNDALIASCADSPKVVVASVNTAHPQILYSDKRHSDVVRGIAWTNDETSLFSCGWDQQIVQHTNVASMAS